MDGHGGDFGGDVGGHHHGGHDGGHHHGDDQPAWFGTNTGGAGPTSERARWIAAGVLLVLLIGLGLWAH